MNVLALRRSFPATKVGFTLITLLCTVLVALAVTIATHKVRWSVVTLVGGGMVIGIRWGIRQNEALMEVLGYALAGLIGGLLGTALLVWVPLCAIYIVAPDIPWEQEVRLVWAFSAFFLAVGMLTGLLAQKLKPEAVVLFITRILGGWGLGISVAVFVGWVPAVAAMLTGQTSFPQEQSVALTMSLVLMAAGVVGGFVLTLQDCYRSWRYGNASCAQLVRTV